MLHAGLKIKKLQILATKKRPEKKKGERNIKKNTIHDDKIKFESIKKSLSNHDQS